MTTLNFRIALSFPEERRDLVKAVAAELEKALGPGTVFLYYEYLPVMARPNLALALQQIYHDRSRLVVAFLDDRYGDKPWCGIEWRAILDLFSGEQSDQVMLLRLTDRINAKGVYPKTMDGLYDARGLSASAVAQAILQRLEWMEAMEEPVPEPRDRPPGPGLLRRFLDRVAPGLHRALTRRGSLFFPEPPGLEAIDEWLGRLAGRAESALWEKSYLPLEARPVPSDRDDPNLQNPQNPFVRFVHWNISRILGREVGGDSASPQIAAVDLKSRPVRNLVRAVLSSRQPLVLLGDPGSGKTLTLQSALLALIHSQGRRVFPVVPVYVRLGELHVEEGKTGLESVRRLVEASCPPSLRRWLAELGRADRLVVFFDGLDEMSRDRYLEQTVALSRFAREDLRGRRSVLTCRIMDFNPKLELRRLVILPFDRVRIARYLRLQIQSPAVWIEGERLTLSRLARRLADGGLSVDARNPFTLFLLCGFLRRQPRWPTSRIELVRDFLEQTYERKRGEAGEDEEAFVLPPRDEAFRAWARFAWITTERNLGSAVPVAALIENAAEPVRTMIRAGKHCGVLAESVQEAEHQIRFEHHRYQEYFAALWIHENRPEIDWLARLDAPRWQETMLNLVLMGGAEEGIEALSASIDSTVKALETGAPEPAPAEIPYEEEALLADRVELGARLLRHSSQISPAVQDRLRPGLRKAVELLVERGKPITQVKMMRACQNLEDGDLLSIFIKPLRSPVQWVRDQALTLVANPQPGRHGTSELPTEMGIDLGSGALLRRWPVYFGMSVSKASARLWMSLLLATLCGLSELVLLLAAASGLFFAVTAELPWIRDQVWSSLLRRPALLPLYAHGTLQALLTLSAAAIGLRSRSGRLWAWVLGSVPIGLLLAVIACDLWQGDLDFLEAVFSFDSYFACIAAVVLLAVLGTILHLSLMAVYAISTCRWRKTGLSTLMSLAWNSSGLGVTLGVAFFLGLTGLVLLALLEVDDGVLFLGAQARDWLSGFAYFSEERQESIYELAMIAGGVALGVYLLVSLVSSFLNRVRAWTLRGVLSAAGDLLSDIGLSVLGSFALGGCLVLLAALAILGLESLAPFTGPLIRGLAILLVAGGALIFLDRMIRALGVQRELVSGSWNREGWKEVLNRSSAFGQKSILSRTHPETLALKPEEYLELLREIEPLIQKEPALSTYWDRRDQLEQALRQER